MDSMIAELKKELLGKFFRKITLMGKYSQIAGTEKNCVLKNKSAV